VDQATATIVGVGLTGVVTAIGWNVSSVLAKRREAETRRVEATVKHIERQIEELYGPLLCLLEQIFNVWTVRENLLYPEGRASAGVTDPRRSEIISFFRTAYFFPLHEKMRGILASKLYLVEGGSVRESFREYLKHSTQQIVQHRLYTELRVPTDEVRGVPWPRAFDADIRASLNRLMAEHERCLRTLHSENTRAKTGPVA